MDAPALPPVNVALSRRPVESARRRPRRLVIALAADADRAAIYRMRHDVYARELGQHPENSAGELLYVSQTQLSPALSPSAASEASTVMQSKGGTRTFTGATGSERDAWTLRLGPKGSTAIWIGFDKPTVIAREARLKALLDEFVDRLE